MLKLIAIKPSLVPWMPPSKGRSKLNLDASTGNPGPAGCGVICDYKREFSLWLFS